MKVFKFGGASLASAEGFTNVARIISQFASDKLLVVVSAIGKTTNTLESMHAARRAGQSIDSSWQALKSGHMEILQSLFPKDHPIFVAIEEIFYEIKNDLEMEWEFDMGYDQIVSKGELISSVILHHYLKQTGAQSEWIDARQFIATDANYRDANVDWKQTSINMASVIFQGNNRIKITQGFIGTNSGGLTTTLGREGSDFTAAIFAATLAAESVTIWKDVAGVMNADPKRLPAAVVFDELPYGEAAEMTYYGASVIHPKTIKPLANKNIPLLVKTFLNPDAPGTRIHNCSIEKLPPLIVFKDNQCLISCKVTDFTFISEEQLHIIFNIVSVLNIKINVMQNSAISFSFCIDFRENKLNSLIEKLQQHFEVYYNLGLTLITVKNYDHDTFQQYRHQPGVLLEQSSRSTLQVLVRN